MRRRAAFNAAFMICATASSSAAAAVWQEVGVSTDGVRAYVDTESLAAGKGWARINQRFVFPKAHPGRLSRVDQQVVYVCDTRTAKTQWSVEFDKDGRVTRKEDGRFIPSYRVPAGTLPEYIFDLLC